MKLKQFLGNLNNLAKESPEVLEFQVVTSKDDEGNGFNAVQYKPSLGMFDGHDFDSGKEANIKPNAICVN